MRRVLPRLASAAGEHRVLIVDDSSPDGTGEIADRLAAELESVEVLHRTEKDGLGRAYAAGFERALAGGAELVIQMDADFSHDPEHLPALIAAAADADLVLGSRYVAGGGVDRLGPAAPALSRGGSWYARTRPRACRSGTSPAASSASAASCSSALDLGGFQTRRLRLPGRGRPTARCAPARASARSRSSSATARSATSKMSSRIVLEALWRVLELRLGRRAPATAG